MVCDVCLELRDLPGADEGQETGIGTRGLYSRLLGAAWSELAEPVRGAHAAAHAVRAHGRLRVEHGDNLLARLIARALGLPQPALAAETHLVVTAGADGERWHRTIGRRSFESRQYDAGGGELAERFRVLEFRFRLDVSGGSLIFRQVGLYLPVGPVRVRWPRVWSPTVDAREDPVGAGRTHVSVRVVAPLLGLVIAYEGTMEFEETRP